MYYTDTIVFQMQNIIDAKDHYIKELEAQVAGLKELCGKKNAEGLNNIKEELSRSNMQKRIREQRGELARLNEEVEKRRAISSRQHHELIQVNLKLADRDATIKELESTLEVQRDETKKRDERIAELIDGSGRVVRVDYPEHYKIEHEELKRENDRLSIQVKHLNSLIESGRKHVNCNTCENTNAILQVKADKLDEIEKYLNAEWMSYDPCKDAHKNEFRKELLNKFFYKPSHEIKVGDRVEMVVDKRTWGLNKGMIGEVIGVYPLDRTGKYHVDFEGKIRYLDDEHIRKVE